MFGLLQQHQQINWLFRRQLLLDSWNELSVASPHAQRLIAFFGSSNLFAPYSMDRQLREQLRRAGISDIVLNMGSFGFGDSNYVLEQTLAALEAYRRRPIDLLVYEVTPNEMPPLSKEVLPSVVRHNGNTRLILDYEDGQRLRARLHAVELPLHHNLERLAAAAHAAPTPFPIAVLDYDTNVREWPPTLSAFSRPVGPRESAAIQQLLRTAMDLVRRRQWPQAVAVLDECDGIDDGIALSVYLRAKIADAQGDTPAAPLYLRANALDLIRGRLARATLMPQLEQWCDQLGCWFISVPAIVSRLTGGAIPGFDVFTDDVHYRPEVHFAIASAIAERLHAEGFIAALAEAEAHDVVGAVHPQPLFTLLQCALNLVMPPHSPFNDERIAEGRRYLDKARCAGCDPAVLDQYRLKFLLLAGLEKPFEEALAAQPTHAVDPATLLFAAPAAANATTQSPVAAEVERQLRALLLLRFGVVVAAADEQIELQRLGIDSLGLYEIIFALEDTFDVKLGDHAAAGLDHRMTFAALRDQAAECILHPQARRLSYEKSLARQRQLEGRSARSLSELRLRPAARVPSAGTHAATSIADVLEQRFREDQDRTAVTVISPDGPNIEPSALTWRDLDHSSAAFASYFADSGVAAGDVVHLLIGHGRHTVAAIIGALRLGAVPSVGNEPSPKMSEEVFFETFATMFRQTGARVVLVGAHIEDTLQARLASEAGAPRVLTTVGVVPWLDGQRARGWPSPDRSVVSTAFLQHSSGTTGARKGVMLSHHAILRHVAHYSRAIDLRGGDCIVSWLPLYHDMGLIACFLLPLLTATPVVLISPFDWINRPQLLFEAITQYRGTLVWLPNFAFNVLVDRVRTDDLAAIDLSSVRAFINCSECVRQESWEGFHDRFAFYGLSRFACGTCYALAENTFAVTQGGIGAPPLVDFVDPVALRRDRRAVPQRTDAAVATALLSSGRPIEGCRMRIADDAGVSLDERVVGEIHITSDTLAAGYHNNPEATSRAFVGEWYRTGDVGYVADGHLFVLGRKGDTIVIAGQNVAADDIEHAVSRQPGIRPGRVAAFGVPSPRLGTDELVILAETVSDSVDETARQRLQLSIRACVYDLLQLGTSKTLLVKPGTLRKTSSGKINRTRMKTLFLEGNLDDALL
jgi:acyl-CoA synthetase (AMP-forming)/AMP-acid ligase II/acyl carrier protein